MSINPQFPAHLEGGLTAKEANSQLQLVSHWAAELQPQGLGFTGVGLNAFFVHDQSRYMGSSLN